MNHHDARGLRILHIIATLRGGGAETLVRELLPRLARRGATVGVLSAYDPKLSGEERAQLPYELIEGRKRGRFDAGFPLRTVSAIRRFRPDIVHTHTVTGKYWGRACALAAGVGRIVHTEHSPQARLASWEWPIALALVRRTDAFVTFSERSARFVTAREPVPQLEIIANGIDTGSAPTPRDRRRARAELAAPDGTIVAAVVANLYPQKNQRLAIEALARLPGDLRSRVRLDLFGSGPDEPVLRECASRLGVAGAVKFWGFRADVRTLLPGVDLMLTVATVEAAPISLLEAMSAGLAIVATPHHGALDLVVPSETGTITRDWSPASVAAALQMAVADAPWRARAGAAGRRRLIERFDIEAAADRHLALYTNLLEDRASRISRVSAAS